MTRQGRTLGHSACQTNPVRSNAVDVGSNFFSYNVDECDIVCNDIVTTAGMEGKYV
jgi:hypothetical protein